MRRQRRGVKLLALMTGLSLLAAACGDDGDDTEAGENGEQEDAARGGEVVDLSAFAGDPPDHIDPLLSTTVAASQLGDSIYNGLTAMDYTGDEPEVRGMVAESWESNDDASEWTFTIREGLSFSDGTPVLPSSFVRAWEIGSDPDFAGDYSYLFGFIEGGEEKLAGDADSISGVEADDEAMTLTVTLADPWAEFDAAVGFHTFYPMPEAREELDDQAEWENQVMVGNGPFVLEAPRGDSSEISMVPNPEWDGTLYDEELELPEQPYLDRVTFRSSSDLDTAYASFEAGEGQLAAIPSGRFEDATSTYGYSDAPALGTYYFQINDRNEMVGGEDNLLLRQAISMAIDREDINTVVYEGSRTTSTGITPEGIPGFEEGLCEYCSYDPDGAQDAFEQWQDEGNELDGPIPIQFNEGFGHEEVVAIMVENLGEIGIEAEADGRDSETYFSDLADGECVICRAGWLADYPTYGNFMYDLFHSSALDGNNYGFQNDDFDQLVEDAQVETDPDARADLYQQAEQVLLNEATGTIPINWYNSTTVYNEDEISNYYEDPSFHIHWEIMQAAQ